MNVGARSLTLAGGLVVVVILAVFALGSVDRTPPESSQFAGWTGRVSIADQKDSAAMTPDDAVAVSLLARAVRAASALSFYATVKSSTLAGTSAIALTHVSGGGTRITDGDGAQWLPAGTAGGFAEAGKSLSLLATNYRVIRNASADTVVAHRSSLAVDAIDDSGRFVARFWMDARTGLLVRKDTMAPNGSVSETYEFTSLDLVHGSFAPLPTKADTWGAAVPAHHMSKLRQSGCGCPDALPGKLSLLETHVSTHVIGGLDRAVHQVFSDGIAAVSLFFVSGSLATADTESLTRIGFRPMSDSPSSVWIRSAGTSNDSWTAVWEKDGRIVTAIVSGAADDRRTLEMIVSAESPRGSVEDTSLVGRMMRGWQRLVGVFG